LIVQNLDHLGIVAGLVDELGIVEQINQHLGEDPNNFRFWILDFRFRGAVVYKKMGKKTNTNYQLVASNPKSKI